MRTALRAAMTLVTACAIAPTLGTPAGAVTTCPGGEPICLYIPAGNYPIPYPVPGDPVSQPITRVPLPRVCDSNGNNCVETFLVVPGVTVTSAGSTLTTVHFPGAGIGVAANGLVTVYVLPPTTSPGDVTGPTATVTADLVLVESFATNGLRCVANVREDYGSFAYAKDDCDVVVRIGQG